MRNTRLVKAFALLAAAVLLVVSFSACGGTEVPKGSVTVSFMYGGDYSVVKLYGRLIEEFNKTVGQEKKIVVDGIPKTGSIDSILAQQLPGNNGPDVMAMTDKEFKKYAGYLEDLTGRIDDSVLADFYPNALSRYHYNVETTTSNPGDPLYAIPSYNNTTILYYNKTALEKNGVICISVNEEDLPAFNAGTGKDANGKTKSEYGITLDVPAKGFFRSITPYVAEPDDRSASGWTMPSDDDVLNFNDRIVMNWDELEDVGLLCTQERNAKSATKYGYYSEFWFNYGWTVGGDCIEDVTGEGDWTYALCNDLPNYIVGKGKTYTGLYSGIVYNAGDTLEVRDIVKASKGDTLSFDTDNSSFFEFTVNGRAAEVRDFSKEIADGTLTELPSMKEAFSRFCHLAGVGGSNVCPYPSAFTGSNAIYYFTSGSLAFLLEYVANAGSIDEMTEDEWGIAQIPAYKTYTDPSDPYCDTVAKQGRIASHSMGYPVAINSKTIVKDQALEFVKWLATDGQRFMVEQGYCSSRKSDRDTYLASSTYRNALAVIESSEVSSAGDWWYMPDTAWIDNWANKLNGKVRFGLMDYETFLYSSIEETNKRLAEYKK